MRRWALSIGLVGVLSIVVPSGADAHTLSFSTARRAAQLRANAFAHQSTQVGAMLRQGLHTYYVQAHWTAVDPVGCKGCGFDPNTGGVYDTPSTEYHSIAMRAVCIGTHSRFNAGRPCAARAYVTDVFG